MIKTFQIKGFSDYYVTDCGDVYSRRSNKYNNPNGRIKKMTNTINMHGYAKVELFNNNKRYYKQIHRLVAETFIPNPDNKTQVNHKNGIKTDNRVENLEWCTQSENVKHTYDILHRKPSKAMLGKFGQLHPNSKIVLQIKDGIIINKFYGTREAQRNTKINRTDISQCCNGKRISAGGYQWVFESERKGGNNESNTISGETD